MKANELMIGDWVFCTYKQKNYKVAEIKTVAGGDLNVVVYDDNIPLVFQMKYFEPIQLVPEILEKNGFAWTTHKSYMVSCIGTVRMIWGFYKDCLSISDHSDEGECQISSLKCKFVHQFQHALRLCGIEKEIIV